MPACCITSAVTSAFQRPVRAELAAKLEPLREAAHADHPWGDWGRVASRRQRAAAARRDQPVEPRQGSIGEPIRIGLVCEVSFEHLQGTRFRHAAHFKRWRPDKPASECRYDQLEETPAYELQNNLRPRAAAPMGLDRLIGDHFRGVLRPTTSRVRRRPVRRSARVRTACVGEQECHALAERDRQA